VISFHSLEDRAVKHFLRDKSSLPPIRRGLPPPPQVELPLKLIGNAQFAGEEELDRNPRARSAVLRVAERLNT
jgi:16S rRNA (cytosine1402-N4)-methyltransferase